MGKQRVTYLYDPDVGNHYYAEGHPMCASTPPCTAAASRRTKHATSVPTRAGSRPASA